MRAAAAAAITAAMIAAAHEVRRPYLTPTQILSQQHGVQKGLVGPLSLEW
jgi:hypothetical protein